MFRIKKKSDHSWEIKPTLPWYKKRSLVISLVVVFLSLIGSYVYLNYTLYSTNKNLKEITIKYQNLKQEYLSLKSVKVRMQRELDIVRHSQAEIQTNLLDLHQQSQDLTTQLDLYKRIMSSNRTSESVLVENFQVKPLEQEDTYLLSWVMLQASNKRNLLEGKLNIKLHGKLGDIAKTFNYSQIAVNKNDNLNYKFRDFQYFNNKIILPKEFNVSDITFEISDDKTTITKSKTFSVSMLGRKINVAQKQEQSSRIKTSS